MKITILTWGTRGDVQPLLALAVRLAAGGDEVRFGAPPAFAEFVRARGIRFAPVGSPMEPAAYQALMDGVCAEVNPRKQNRHLLQQVLLRDLERLYADSLAAARGADLVVSHWLQVGAGLAAEVLGIPWATVTLHPAGLEHMAGPGTPDDARREEEMSAWLWGDRLHQFRAELGLPPVRSIAASLHAPRLNLVAVSPHLVPGHQAWPANHVSAGFFWLEPQEAWRPDAALERFLERNEPPIVVSFSSIAGQNVDGSGSAILEALARLDYPAILQSGWSGLGARASSDRILNVGDVPHAELFARAACVVHHGGAGTTGAALRAGVPSVIVWHVFDQPYWGNLLAAQGLGPRPIARSSLEPAALAQRIEEALSNPAYRAGCAALAQRMAGDGGVDAAARAIRERFAGPAVLRSANLAAPSRSNAGAVPRPAAHPRRGATRRLRPARGGSG